MSDAIGVLLELRSHLDAATARELFVRAHTEGFRLLALFTDGECCAVAGYRIGTSFANGRYLYVDDLVTSAGRRSRGHGRMLLDRMADIATAAGCDCVTLDSGVHRFGAHKFYVREGFVISSHHFWRGLKRDASPSSMREG